MKATQEIYLTLSSKGGIGKTPLTVELAQEFGLAGKKVGLIDLDGHTKTAQTIVRQAKLYGHQIAFDVLPSLKEAKGYKYIFIDTPAAFASFATLDSVAKDFVFRMLAISTKILCPITPELAHLTAVNNTLDDLFFRMPAPVAREKVVPVALKIVDDAETKLLQTLAVSRELNPLPTGLPRCDALAAYHNRGELVAQRTFNGTRPFATNLSVIAQSLGLGV